MRTVRFQVYLCDKCDFVTTTPSKCEAHVARKTCAPANVAVALAEVTAPACVPPNPSEARRCVLGRPALTLDDILRLMQGRIPSGIGMIEDDLDSFGIDERVRYLCDRPDVLAKVFEVRKPIVVSIKLFAHLWGDQAPLEYRTVFCRSNTVYELQKYDDIAEFPQGEQLNEFLVYLFKTLVEIGEAIKSRRIETYSDRAAEYVDLMLRKDTQLPTMDVMLGTETYKKYRQKCQGSVHFKNKFESAMRKLLLSTRISRP